MARLVAAVALLAVTTVLGAGCGGGGDRDLTLEFDTTFAVDDTLTRTSSFFTRNGYEWGAFSARRRDAEKRRPLASGGGSQVDVLQVTAERGNLYTRVTIHAFTDLDDERGRRRAGQVSDEARRDAETLQRELLGPNARRGPRAPARVAARPAVPRPAL